MGCVYVAIVERENGLPSFPGFDRKVLQEHVTDAIGLHVTRKQLSEQVPSELGSILCSTIATEPDISLNFYRPWNTELGVQHMLNLKVQKTCVSWSFRQGYLRHYHDESFGFRKPRDFVLPDCA
jgi:hypothetical protein